MPAHRRFWSVFSLCAAIVCLILPSPGISQSDATGKLHNTSGVCHQVDPNDAIARGTASALIVRENITHTNLPFAPVKSERKGPGNASKDDNGLVIDVPSADSPSLGKKGSIAHIGLFESHAVSTVAPGTLRSDQHSTAEVADVTLLGGSITARALRASATTATDGEMADLTGNSSATTDVVVNGVAQHQVAQGLRVPLPAAAFGDGSFVRFYDRTDIGFFPDHKHIEYRSDLSIDMIHVYVRDYLPAAPGDQSLEIIVAQATAYSQTPTPFCGGIQGVHASAYDARVRTKPYFWAPSVKVGYTKVPVTGGYSDETWSNVSVPAGNQNIVFLGALESQSSGKVKLEVKSSADAIAKVTHVCVKRSNAGPEDDCLISAEALRADSHARAFQPGTDGGGGRIDHDGRMWWGNVTIVNLTINHVSICAEITKKPPVTNGTIQTCSPPKNTHFTIAGGFDVYLNERVRSTKPDGHIAYTVRAVRIDHPTIGSITLARAFAEADFR
jgi:hypothetical protein